MVPNLRTLPNVVWSGLLDAPKVTKRVAGCWYESHKVGHGMLRGPIKWVDSKRYITFPHFLSPLSPQATSCPTWTPPRRTSSSCPCHPCPRGKSWFFFHAFLPPPPPKKNPVNRWSWDDDCSLPPGLWFPARCSAARRPRPSPSPPTRSSSTSRTTPSRWSTERQGVSKGSFCKKRSLKSNSRLSIVDCFAPGNLSNNA